MKKLATLSFTLCLANGLFAQTTQDISTGTGYQKQSYVNLSAGTEKQVANTAWDIAFSVAQADFGVFINESSGSSMGSPLPLIEIYDALTENFSEQPDPSFVVDFQLLNSEKSWSFGAFNERRFPDDALDLGWGTYNPQTGEVLGTAVYVLKLRNGQYRKIRIESLINGVYTFKYANLDGTNELTKTINKADHAGKTLAYFSLETGATVNVEPASGGFDLFYGRYIAQLLDPTTGGFIPYYVTGILSGPGTKVAEADGVDPATVAYADYQDSLRTELDVIGHDWKYFNLTSWSLDADRVFFLKAKDDRVWKLRFIDFGGSIDGTTTLEKTDLGIILAVQDPAAAGMKAAVYPNPVADQLTVSLDIPAALAQRGLLQVIDLQGREVFRQSADLKTGFQVLQLQAAGLNAGLYQVQLQLTEQVISLGKVVKL